MPTGWTLLMLGLRPGPAVITTVPALRWTVTLLGVSYMLWLAFKLQPRRADDRGGRSRPQVGFGRAWACSFVNIKAWMLALTLRAGWVVNAARPAGHQPG